MSEGYIEVISWERLGGLRRVHSMPRYYPQKFEEKIRINAEKLEREQRKIQKIAKVEFKRQQREELKLRQPKVTITEKAKTFITNVGSRIRRWFK